MIQPSDSKCKINWLKNFLHNIPQLIPVYPTECLIIRYEGKVHFKTTSILPLLSIICFKVETLSVQNIPVVKDLFLKS
jgi:hypothetical protein